MVEYLIFIIFRTKNPFNFNDLRGFQFYCGKRGIRTLGTVARTTVFETVPFDRSGIFPERGANLILSGRFFTVFTEIGHHSWFSTPFYVISYKPIVHQNFCHMTKKVADILLRKGSHITTVSPQSSVLEALHIMADQNIGSVVVLDNGRYLGIMTERDYSRKVVLNGKSSTDTTVAEIMSNNLPRVTASDSIDYCMQLMSDRNIRYLPVFDGEQLTGIISINDVVKETILSHEETITQLKDYLHSSL